MKIKVLVVACLILSLCFSSKAQSPSRADSLKGFDMNEMEHHLEHFKGTLAERNARIENSKRVYIVRKYKLDTPQKLTNARNSGNHNTEAISCTNVDFESGSTAGWTIAGSNYITSGAGVDPFGNFPLVFAGNNSLQLSDNNLGTSNFTSSATRVISVPATGTNFFKLSFAVDILDYPHTQAAAAKFDVNFYNAAGTLIPCPQYECYFYQNSAGTGVNVGATNFQTTAGSPGVNLGGQTFPVTYAPWQTVALDLTAYDGTNVTCVVTCKWCLYNYDWAYCYIDAECPTTSTSTLATCVVLPATISSTTGMDTYSWIAPPGNTPATATTPTINATVAGIYTCNTTVNTCSVAAYTFTYNVLPGPSPSFTNTLASACSGNISFASTSSTNGGPPLSGYTWEWGDGTANGATANAAHTFTGAAGTKTVTLVITNGTCIDSVKGTIVIPSHPVASFNLTNNCLNAVSNYTSTATATAGIASQTWNFGDATNGTGATPSHTYVLSGTYAVTLVVTDINSCKDSITQPITIYPLPPVTVNSSTICAGQQIATLTANGAVTYAWNPSATLSGGTGNIVTGTPAATTTYTVTGTDANICSNTATSTITVNTLPPVAVNSSTICVGQQTATLTAVGAITYAWNPPATLSGGTGNIVTGTPAVTTTYTVTGTDANTCTNTATSTITVNPLPPVTVNISTICVGQQTATLTATGAVTYAWSPSATLSGSTGATVTGTPAVTTNYVVTGTDGNGCVSTANSTITVNSLPPVAVNSSTICVGQQIATLTAVGAITYTWNPSATLSSGTGSPVTGTPAATNTYTVTGTDANTCTNTATSTITVNTLPPVAVNSSTICVGQQIATLTAAGAVTYAWSPSATLSGSTGATVTGTPITTTHYTVTGTDINGCTDTATSTITVHSLPTVTVNISTICVGQQTATLTATGAVTYAWSPSATLSSGTGSPVTGTPIATTTYVVTGTDGNGCVSTANSTITVNSLPPVAVNSSTICVGQQIATLTAVGAITYTWNPSATLSSGTGSLVTGTPIVTTTYVVAGIDANTCTNTATTTITVNNLPPVTVNSSTICVGQQTATLTATGAVTYAWNPTISLNPTSGSLVHGTPAVTTTYVVTGTDANGCVNTATSTIMVNILPLPTATSNTPCVSQQALVLNCTPNGMASYTWSGPNSFASTVQSPTITVANVIAADAGVYTLVVMDNNTCTNTVTINVTIHPLPVVTVNSPTVCENQTINLTCLPNGMFNYSWSGPNNLDTALQNPSIVHAALNMTGSYAIVVTDGFGCYNSNVAQVVVNPLPVISVNTDTICLGQKTATLTAHGAVTYTWTPPTTLNSITGTTVLGDPIITTNYTVSGTDNHGCVSDTATIIVVRTLPIIATSSVVPNCVPLCTSFTATSNPAASVYTWNFSNGQTPTPTTLSPPSSLFITATCFTLAATYPINLTIKDIHGCVSTATTIAVAYPIPVADFDYLPKPITILAPEVQFLNQSAGMITSYNWNLGDSYCSTATDTSILINPAHTYLSVGTYSVTLTVTSNKGCSSTVVKPIVVNETYAIYIPNAFTPNGDGKNEFFLAEGEGINSFKLYVFDRWGLLLYYSDDINKGWDGTYQAKGAQILQEDVYVWKIDLTDFTNKAKSLHGTVTLLK